MGERQRPIEAEQCIIGSIILEPALLPMVRQQVRVEDFTDERHRVLWDAILAMAVSFEPIDEVTVVSRLKQQGKADKVPPLYLANLVERVPLRGEVEHYARIVRNAAGVRALYAAARKAIKAIEEGDDADTAYELLAKTKATIDSREPTEFSDIVDDFDGLFDELKKREETGAAVSPDSFVTSGYTSLDEKLIGYGKGQLIILAGESGGGKTALSLNCAARQVMADKRVNFFSGEMGSEALARRVLAAASRVNHHVLRKGLMGAEDWTRATRAKAAFQRGLFAVNDKIATIDDVVALAMRSHLQKPCDVIYIDYLQRLIPRGGAKDNREQMVAQGAVDCKNLARKLQVPVVVLSQMNEAGQLRESKAVFHEADVVMQVKIPGEGAADKHEASVKILKQRDGENLVSVPLNWQREYVRFDEHSWSTPSTDPLPHWQD